MKRRKRLEAGQIWVTRDPKTRTPSRRIIDVIQRNVCYSTGGESSRWCQRTQFLAWIRTYCAKATRTSQPRTLALRPLRARALPRRGRKEVARARL